MLKDAVSGMQRRHPIEEQVNILAHYRRDNFSKLNIGG